MHRQVARSAIATLALLPLMASSVLAASPTYAGWSSNGYWKGVNGYLRQAVTGATAALHANWINLCPRTGCSKWVQTGTFQGEFAGGSSHSAVHILYENVDGCGDYYRGDLGAPPSLDYPYGLNYSGAVISIQCDLHDHQDAFQYRYTKGGVTTAPFFLGTMPSVDGTAISATELQGNPPISTDYFGCDPGLACSQTAYGLHLYNGSTWSSWTAPSTKLEAQPPWLHTFHNFWSFKTCPAAC